ncbi:MAG: Na/Pi cotransporter family protein [Bdellovibrionales bacterium]|nr:Na/Pi cotransporter family protein [Bdellovibrionales bacterium]
MGNGSTSFDLWALLGGLGIFLFGMHFVEQALRELAGSSFKRFLRDHTKSPLQGIVSGTIATAMLQSSSVVTLMLLAFVGAGIMTLNNALGVVLGSNFGTTFTGWIVASLGFRVDIESFALPCIAVGSLGITFFLKRERELEISKFLVGFGFLFLGLSYMKGGIVELTTVFNLASYKNLHPYLFFPIGLGLTALIQSSSATMVIVLSALHAGVLSLPAAGAMVVGADLGTTITAILGSLGGSAPKKQVAYGHVSFNVISDLIALLLLFPLLGFFVDILHFEDPLFVLVLFHSTFNLLGIIIVAPFLGTLARFLQRMFPETQIHHARYISKVGTEIPEASLEALSNDVRRLLQKVLTFNLRTLGIRDSLFKFAEEARASTGYSNPYIEQYEEIKELEGELVNYSLALHGEKLAEEEANRIVQLTLCVRSAVLSAKALKDIHHNLRDFERSANDILLGLLDRIRGQTRELYLALDHICIAHSEHSQFEALLDVLQQNKRSYDKLLAQVHEQVARKRLSELETSTLLNVSFETYNATRSLISSLKDLLLTREQALDFNNLPEMK